MLKDFYNSDHINAYMSGTIIRYKGDPIYVHEAWQNNGRFRLKYSDITSRDEPKTILLDNKDIDINPFPLGFVNNKTLGFIRDQDKVVEINIPSIVLRIPSRRWKVGVDSRSVDILSIETQASVRPNFPDRRAVLYSQGFKDCVKNIYPSFGECCARLLNKDRMEYAEAFSRRFALDVNGFLYYYQSAHKYCGKFDPKTGGLILNDNFFFLKEVLDEDVNG